MLAKFKFILLGWHLVHVPCSFNSLSAMYITELAQTEPVSPRWVHIAIHSHDGARRGHLKCLPNLNVHLKISNGTPVVRSWKRGKKLMLYVKLYIPINLDSEISFAGVTWVCQGVSGKIYEHGKSEPRPDLLWGNSANHHTPLKHVHVKFKFVYSHLDDWI